MSSLIEMEENEQSQWIFYKKIGNKKSLLCSSRKTFKQNNQCKKNQQKTRFGKFHFFLACCV